MIETKAQLKTYFETGDIPTQAQFVNLIDTLLSFNSAEVSTLTNKATPAAGDNILIEDSADSNNKKRVTFSQFGAGFAPLVHTHAAADVVSGTFDDARVSQSNVTQHEAALTITESQISDLNHTDVNAIHDNVAGEIAAIAVKAAPTASDFLIIEDAAAANVKKHITIGTISITESQISDLTHTDPDAIHDNVAGEIAAITEKTAPVPADLLVIEDSAAANAKKRVQIDNLPRKESFSIAISDMTTALTASTSKAYWRAPYNGTLLSIAASVGTAPTGANIIIDANDGAGGTSIMTTNKCVIEISEFDTITATTQPTLTTTAFTLGDQIWFDIDQVGSTIAGLAAQVHLEYRETL